MDEESLANGRDNVIEVKRTMGKKGKMLLTIAAIVVVLGLVTALLRYNAIKTYTQYLSLIHIFWPPAGRVPQMIHRFQPGDRAQDA